ncbi:excalibur calcium-binding domain-containing protein [Gallibacterium anatis]|uniref:excalibur calcium-binding domain-containing protein n=2 Tax=Gallibacterium anatis TaxID=750 RepID=UPI000BA011E8|nr:excalibur calcium-binding domain-containing protein [Gallibacterium anatis]UZD16764.1 excalibur calcium-binding domain-containing protein [Gallibacterium anatis]WAX72371.1 excalibur calcium-binding domain-containing protein [Gallibacterium anatis]
MKKLLLLITALLFTQSALAAKQEYSCDDGKRYCKEMRTCEEAKYHLEQCGLSRLDRDKDGVPCESICRQ